MTVFRDLKTMRLREPGQLLVACLVDDVLVFLVPNIADALQEKQREYIGFEVSCIDRPPQDIRRLPKVALKLAQCNFTCAQCSVPNLPVQMANLCRVSLFEQTRVCRTTMRTDCIPSERSAAAVVCLALGDQANKRLPEQKAVARFWPCALESACGTARRSSGAKVSRLASRPASGLPPGPPPG